MPTNWRETIKWPIFRPGYGWHYSLLENVLSLAIGRCTERCWHENKGSIWLTLSGGLDSSYCAAEARRLWPNTVIHAATIVGGQDHPDRYFSDLVARQFGLVHHTFVATEQEIARAQAELKRLWPNEPLNGGNEAVFMLYRHLGSLGVKSVIAHDGIDELLGGYWEHRRHTSARSRELAFADLWRRLAAEHLELLERKASKFGIRLELPYLEPEVVHFITTIPLSERTDAGASKIPLRRIAAKYLPDSVLERPKVGFCHALSTK